MGHYTRSVLIFKGLLEKLPNRRWTAQMMFLHGHPTAAVANKFHLRQFIFTHMLRICLWVTTEATFFGVIAGAA